MANTLFALMVVRKPEEMESLLAKESDWFSLKVGDDQWFLVAPSEMTTKEISDKLGITGGATTGAVVLRAEGYFGHTSVTTWEWIAAKMGAPLDATGK